MKLHGLGGSKKTMEGFCTTLIVKSGRLCVAADYTANLQKKPQAFADTHKFVMWFYDNAGDYNVNKDSIVLAGYSFGGISINGVLWDKEMGKDLLAGEPPKICAVMLFNGIGANNPGMMSEVDLYPQSTLIISSDTDTKVRYEYSVELADDLKEKGQKVDFINFPGVGHGPWSKVRAERDDAVENFLDKVAPS